jgi:uncharacterized membrane protein YphA (DoxX/SURF4 family)
MTGKQQSSQAVHIILWIAQVLLAALFIMGAIMKFQPIAKISVMMPWMGQVPVWFVRLLAIVDLAAALGLILPSLLRIKPKLTPWAAIGSMMLMLCASAFHVARGEASAIGLNIAAGFIAAFIAWGRFAKSPIQSK